MKKICLVLFCIFIYASILISDEKGMEDTIEYGLFLANSAKLLPDNFWNINPNAKLEYKLYEKTDTIPKQKNITFGIMWKRSKLNKNNKIICRVEIYRGNVLDKEKIIKLVDERTKKKFNIEYYHVLTLDQDDDFSYKYYLIEIYLDNNLLCSQIFNIAK